MQDFLGINWSGSDLTFLSTLPEFMKVVIPQLYRSGLQTIIICIKMYFFLQDDDEYFQLPERLSLPLSRL